MLHVMTYDEFINAISKYDMSSLLCSITDSNGCTIMLVNLNQLLTWLLNATSHDMSEFDYHCHTLPIFNLTMEMR